MSETTGCHVNEMCIRHPNPCDCGEPTEVNVAGLNALRDGTRGGPAAPMRCRDHVQAWIDEDRRIRERLAATR